MRTSARHQQVARSRLIHRRGWRHCKRHWQSGRSACSEYGIIRMSEDSSPEVSGLRKLRHRCHRGAQRTSVVVTRPPRLGIDRVIGLHVVAIPHRLRTLELSFSQNSAELEHLASSTSTVSGQGIAIVVTDVQMRGWMSSFNNHARGVKRVRNR